MRGATLILTLTLSPVAGWTAGVWHAGFVAARSAQLSRLAALADTTAVSLAPDASTPVPDTLSDSEPTVGPEGDDVMSAVATYSRDDEGELYEEHSPQTEVARLREPVG